MKRTLFFGSLLILSVSLCGCVGSPCGPCGPYNCYPNQFGACVNECNSCDPCGTPACSPMSYAYGTGCGTGCGTPYCGLPGAPIRTIGCGAAQIAATPVSWLAQILRGTCYPCNGCGDERYWGDYGYVPGDFCSPCTYDGQWAGNDQAYGSCGGCGDCTVCQQGISYRYPAVGTYMNQMYAPVFQDKIAATHAKTPLDYGLRGYDSCGCEPCGCNTCYTGSCSTGCSTGCDTGCSTGCSTCDTGCDSGYINENGARISPGYAPPRQQPYYYGNASSNITSASYRTAKPSASVANKVHLPVR
ncbi:MAG: hypothetical protein FWC43_07615 [Planctomycetaceae bacterium]|nr:hypothetical protein [Planctomycetaceae bacterium]